MDTAYNPITMNQFHSGMASNLVPALSEGTFPSFPVHQPYFFERELCGSCITSFGTSVAALKSTCTLPSNSTPSDHHIYNNAKLSSGQYDTEQFDSETLLPSRYPTFKGNSSSLMMIVPKASEPISWNQEKLQGLIDYPIGIYFSNQQDVNPVGKQIQDSITMDLNTQTAKENEWFSSGRSVQFLGSAVSVLKDIDARSLTPQNYSYCQVRSVSPFNYDEVSTDTLPSNTTPTKLRMRWTPELHEQFVEAINMLGGSEKATPKAIQRVMKVKGLTIYHVKSHLQKYRAIQHRPESSDGRSLTDEVPIPQLREMIFTYTDHVLTYFVNSRGWASADTPTGLKNVEGLRTQIGFQKQLYEQLEIQRKLQLQVEEHSKYLEMIIAKQSESLKKFGALPGCQDRSQPVLGDTKACEERTICARNSESRN